MIDSFWTGGWEEVTLLAYDSTQPFKVWLGGVGGVMLLMSLPHSGISGLVQGVEMGVMLLTSLLHSAIEGLIVGVRRGHDTYIIA